MNPSTQTIADKSNGKATISSINRQAKGTAKKPISKPASSATIHRSSDPSKGATKKSAKVAASKDLGEPIPKPSGRRVQEPTGALIPPITPVLEQPKAKQKTTAVIPAPAIETSANSALGFEHHNAENVAHQVAKPQPRMTKQEQVLTMLSCDGGTTIAVIMAAMGWQEHSVRGFLAGTVRKKLGFDLQSAKFDSGVRSYWIKV